MSSSLFASIFDRPINVGALLKANDITPDVSEEIVIRRNTWKFQSPYACSIFFHSTNRSVLVVCGGAGETCRWTSDDELQGLIQPGISMQLR